MLSLMPRAAYLGLWFCSVSDEKLQSHLLLKCFKYCATAMGCVQSLSVTLLTDFCTLWHGFRAME